MGVGEPSSSNGLLYRFGPYQADTRRGELRKFGIRVRLERKPWQLLLVLLERSGDLVTRSQLRSLLWGDNVFVDFENGINVAVKKLRSALGDSAEAPSYLETVTGEGYRFVAKVKLELSGAGTTATKPLESGQSGLFPSTQVPAEGNLGLAAESACQSKSWKRLSLFAAFGLIGIALLPLTGMRTVGPKIPSPEAVRSDKKIMLVVLPFENLSGDPNQEYFSDGMTEELSEHLGNQDPPWCQEPWRLGSSGSRP